MQMNNKLNHLIWKYPYFLTPNEKHSEIQFILKRFRTGSIYKSIYFMGTFFHNIYVTSMLSVVLKFCSIGNIMGTCDGHYRYMILNEFPFECTFTAQQVFFPRTCLIELITIFSVSASGDQRVLMLVVLYVYVLLCDN